MKVYRGIKLKLDTIPKASKFTTNFNEAKEWALFKKGGIVSVDSKDLVKLKGEENSLFKMMRIKDRYYTNLKPIKNFSRVVEL